MKAGAILETILYTEDLAAARHFHGTVPGLEVYWQISPRFVFLRNREHMLLVFNPMHSTAQNACERPPPHETKGAGPRQLAKQLCRDRRMAKPSHTASHRRLTRHGLA